MVAWGAAAVSLQPGPLTAPICLQVERGSSFRAVADKLEERGAITSRRSSGSGRIMPTGRMS